MIRKIIFLFLLLQAISSWSQKRTDNISREIINAQISYINLCTNHIAAMNQDLVNFNYDLDQSVKAVQREQTKQIRPVTLKYKGQLHYSYTHAQLDSIYTKTAALRADLDTNTKQALDKFFDKYQNLFKSTTDNFDVIKKLAGNGKQRFVKSEITHGFELLTSLETKISQLSFHNVIFSDLAITLFGAEELPLALQISKDIVAICQQMIRQVRTQDEQGLAQSIKEHKKLVEVRITGDELRILEAFGDFDYTDNIQTQERANIKRFSMSLAKDASHYLDRTPDYSTDNIEKKYGRQFSYEQRITYNFHDYGLGLSRRYNAIIQRAKVPIMQCVQETMPFKVFYTQGYEPKVEASLLDTPIVNTIEPSKTTYTQTEIVQDTLSTSLPFIEDDLSTLNGANTNNLVLLLDVSASMRRNENLTRLKNSINYLIDRLRPEDQLTVITYSGTVQKVLETSTDYNKQDLKDVISNLKSNGKTNANAGLEMAYKSCRSTFIHGGNNRIILASDGDFRIRNTLKKYISEQAKKDIHLSTFHYFSPNSKVKNQLIELAKKGKGKYIMISNEKDAIAALILSLIHI